MAHYPPWPPAAASPSAHPSNYPPPPPLPPSTAGQTMALPPELQALNITPQQMAALLTHLQAGTLPFPPLPPPPPPPPQSYQSAAPFAPVPFPPPVPTHAAFAQHPPVSTAVPSHMDIDREDGEVSDAAQHVNRMPSAPASKKRKSRNSHLAHRAAPQPGPSSTPTMNTSDVSQPSVQQKREAVLPFIAALHQEGFTFDEFVREGFEETLLRQVYQDLQIPVSSPQVPNAQVPATETMPVRTSSAAPTQLSTVVPIKETKPAVPVKQAAPVSRQDYLARLQAAKNKKAEAAPSKGSMQSTKSATPPPAKIEDAPPPAKMPTPVQPKIEDVQTVTPAIVATNTKQSQTTELIRKKMEALKATQRRLANNMSSGSSTPASLPTSHATGPSQLKATPPPPTGSFSGTPLASSQLAAASLIPGLRMSTSIAKSPQPQLQVQSAISTAPSTSSASAISSKDPTPQPPVMPSVHMARKRPVASDLNEAQTVSDHHPFKRPFGKSRQNSFDAAMIIQVSDDEDSSDDDDDDELSSAKPPVKASAVLTGQRNKNISDLPPLRDFPQRSVACQKQSGVFTPPLGTPGISSDAEELRRKELEITSLNQRIQEYEKRKAALKAKASLTESQPQTPSQVLLTSGKTSALPTLGAGAPHIPADRRTELKAALTARNADIDTQKARILEMQKQMADMQRQYDQDMENQQKLREELESLDVDTEGMTQSEMEAKKQEIEDLQDLKATGPASNGTPADNEVLVTESAEADDMDISMSESDSDSSPDDTIAVHQLESSRGHRDATTSSPGRARVLDDVRADRAKAEQNRSQVEESSSDSDSGSSMSESSESEDEDEEDPESTNNMVADVSDGLESESENVESAEPEVAESQDKLAWLFIRNLPYSATNELMHSFFKAFDVKQTHLPRRPGRNKAAGHGFVQLPLSQAVTAIFQLSGRQLENRKVTIQMSKFEPKLPPSPSPEPSSASSDCSSDDEMDISTGSEDESEDGASDAAAASSAQKKDAPTGTSVDDASASDTSADEEDDDENMDESEDEDRMDLESSDGSSEDYSPKPAAIPSSALPPSQSSNNSKLNLADDLAPELQPTAEQQVGVSEAVSLLNRSQRVLTVVQVNTTESNGTTFKPYESLLKNFKGYRYHPDYPHEVSSGYRSLTYSHQIDPNKELCRYEVASGVCNDSSCEYQHFSDMAVSGASEGATF
ncbi:hypothetical protein E4T52_11851 [Aureobasidium sp. EXF-3400]|nr:hypothetical protein E4T51_10947 [Aureobasidium sp. EXF-12344]KAI4773184.1 hypothetical protein E4T52_11851 [Aureobasidium sp. EXF-3400]